MDNFGRKVIIGVNCAVMRDGKANIRQKVAIDVLLENKPSNAKVVNFCYLDERQEQYRNVPTVYLKRNSKDEIGNTRPLPYIKEIFNALASSEVCPEDNFILGYINSDILLTKDFFDILHSDAEAFMFGRTEITEVWSVSDFNKERYKPVWGGDSHPGVDGFFFDKDWWVENSHLFHDDLILGETEWDTVYRHIVTNNATDYVYERELLHVYHDAKWSTSSPGAVNNIKIWEQVRDGM